MEMGKVKYNSNKTAVVNGRGRNSSTSQKELLIEIFPPLKAMFERHILPLELSPTTKEQLKWSRAEREFERQKHYKETLEFYQKNANSMSKTRKEKNNYMKSIREQLSKAEAIREQENRFLEEFSKAEAIREQENRFLEEFSKAEAIREREDRLLEEHKDDSEKDEDRDDDAKHIFEFEEDYKKSSNNLSNSQKDKKPGNGSQNNPTELHRTRTNVREYISTSY